MTLSSLAAGSPLRARYQGAGFAFFGALGFVVAIRYFIGASTSPLIVLVAGAAASALAWFRTAKRVETLHGVSSDSDGGMYIGFLLGAVVAAALLVTGRPEEWVLPGLLVSVALFMIAMARFEASTLGLSAALSLAMLAALVGAVQLSTWVSWTVFSLSIMLLTAGFVVSTDGRART